MANFYSGARVAKVFPEELSYASSLRRGVLAGELPSLLRHGCLGLPMGPAGGRLPPDVWSSPEAEKYGRGPGTKVLGGGGLARCLPADPVTARYLASWMDVCHAV